MKTVVLQDNKLIKAAFDLSGKFVITLVGGEQHAGEFTKDELTQIAFRFHEATKGKLMFDPLPVDIMSLHNDDVATLERQAVVISDLRAENGDLTRDLAQAEETSQAFSKDLIACRDELKNARIEISLLNEKLAKVDSGVTMTLEFTPNVTANMPISLGEIVTATFPPETRTAENPHIGSALDSELTAETGEVQTKLPPDKFEANFEESAPLL